MECPTHCYAGTSFWLFLGLAQEIDTPSRGRTLSLRLSIWSVAPLSLQGLQYPFCDSALWPGNSALPPSRV